MISKLVFKRLLFFLICFQPLSGICQSNLGKSIDRKIHFEGLEKTKENFLRDLISIEHESTLDSFAILRQLQILKNQTGISNATFSIERDGDVVYQIEERRTLLPIVKFGGIRDNIWFALGAEDNNFLGRGTNAAAFYQNNNGRHTGKLYFRNPRISNSQWGFSTTLNKWTSDEPVFFSTVSVDYRYDNYGAEFTFLRNFGLRNRLEIGANLFQERYTKLDTPEGEVLPGPDNFELNKLLSSIIFQQDYVNYHFFYLEGYEHVLNYQNVHSFNEDNPFNSIIYQGRLFLRPKEELNFAVRLKLALATNNDSPFAPFVVDSHVNIRGVGNRIDRGTAQAILNIEARRTYYHEENLAIQGVAFLDLGTWRNPGGRLADLLDSSKFRQFVGLGIRINYLKIFGATLRVDYGIDIFDPDQRGIVLGLGQYF